MPGGNKSPPACISSTPRGDLMSISIMLNRYSSRSRSRMFLASSQNRQSLLVSRITSRSAPTDAPFLDVRNQRVDGQVHRVVGSAPVIGAPEDPPVGTDQDERVTVPAVAHHPVAVRAVGGRHGEVGIGEHGLRDPCVAHLLLDLVDRVGRDRYDLIDPKRLEPIEVLLYVDELVPTGLARQPLLEVQQDGL